MSTHSFTVHIFTFIAECQGGEFAPTGSYSPMFNDIWSLGIILLNLATGRNPWKSATGSDPTFQAYLRDPLDFLPSVLPISYEVNAVLTRMLEVDWRQRMTLPELRQAIEDVTTFYSDNVVFEGSMARCPWESGMEIDSDNSTKEEYTPPPPQPQPRPAQNLRSCWSKDSTSEIIFASQSAAEEESTFGQYWTKYSSCAATWGFESLNSQHDKIMYDSPPTPGLIRTPDSPTSGSIPSMPTTPAAIDIRFNGGADAMPLPPLTINTNCRAPRYYNRENSSGSFSSGSSVMHTAIEFNHPYSPSYFIPSPMSPAKASFKMPSSVDLGLETDVEDRDMDYASAWEYSNTVVSSPSTYVKEKSFSSPDIITDSSSPNVYMDQNNWTSKNSPLRASYPMMSEIIVTPVTPPPAPSSRPQHPRRSKRLSREGKSKHAGLFNPIKFFPRSSASRSRSRSPSPTSSPPPRHRKAAATTPYNRSPYRPQHTETLPSPNSNSTSWAGFSISRPRSPTMYAMTDRQNADRNQCGRTVHARLSRSARHWFSPGKFFAAAGAS